MNKPNEETVLPEEGPVIVSDLLTPSVSGPTIVKVFSLSLPVDVIDTLVPEVDPKPGFVPTLIPLAAASDEICVIVLKNLVPFTVFAFTPVIVSVCAVPSTSVPVIVKVTEELLFELEIVTVDFKFEAATVDKAPSIVKLPELPRVSLSTQPSLSAVTEFNPFIVQALAAVPD